MWMAKEVHCSKYSWLLSQHLVFFLLEPSPVFIQGASLAPYFGETWLHLVLKVRHLAQLTCSSIVEKWLIQAITPKVSRNFWERSFLTLVTELLEATISPAPLAEGRRKLVAPGIAGSYHLIIKESQPRMKQMLGKAEERAGKKQHLWSHCWAVDSNYPWSLPNCWTSTDRAQ